MIDLIVCEDNDSYREKLMSLINKCILINDFDMKINFATGDPNKIIEHITTKQKEMSDSKIFFLDIVLNHEKNGLNLAANIRSQLPQAKIIFLTSYPEFSMSVFEKKIEAVDYILKDFDEEALLFRLNQCLSYCSDFFHKEWQSNDDFFSYKLFDKTFFVAIDDVICLQSSPNSHQLLLYTNNDIVEFYGTLSQCKKKFSFLFQTHRSCLVNPVKIEKIDKKRGLVLLPNNIACPISKRKINYFEKYLKERQIHALS
ncbi:LytR/AlgR family response regulator transcription factor [Vagococcus acidifermentans]|uniref:DNA-binding response regulator n=1 Tax=Vagococcus acidifermentans TaxID=564710 RepID=A0A430ATX1_9ENTE|nr:LytTR family DNA-binding domain-containing protein [Vagococcus acidifermentans]RSU11507.1 hypothetical protein CBF27_08425 [Vagococcus acidifermentans]